MYIRIKGDEIYGMAYPKEYLINILSDKFKEIEKDDKVVKYIYLNYMMFDFFKENIDGQWLKGRGKKYRLWTAVLIKQERCYDVFLSDEILDESIWGKK